MHAKTMHDKMEDRIRFGSDGNGIFVAVRLHNRGVWTLYTDRDEFQIDWQLGAIGPLRNLPAAEAMLALGHFGCKHCGRAMDPGAADPEWYIKHTCPPGTRTGGVVVLTTDEDPQDHTVKE